MKKLKINWFIVLAAGLMAIAIVKEFSAQISIDTAQVAAQEAAIQRIQVKDVETFLAKDKAARQFVFVYASWCGACHQVMPYVLRALEGKKDISAFFISLDKDPKKLAIYLAEPELQGKFTPYLINPSEKSALAAMLKQRDATYTDAIPFLAIFKHGKREIDSTTSDIQAVIEGL
jgi:thiol-disulfide isomerase/thioredoxin